MELLKMKNISKSFFGVKVLDDVTLDIGTGEVHALLGENGAGKSTLMNILAGVYTKDDGTVIYDGKEMAPHITVKETEKAGIAFVHQELNIFNDLRAYENLFLGREIRNKFGKLNKKEMIEETRQLMQSLGVDINPMELADNLDTSKKQLLEIAKTLYADAKLFILDEPTTALNNEEIEKLFDIIRKLKEKDKTFIFISHKMPEIFEIADKYTVLRNGKFINSGYIKDTSPEEVTKYMVGESYSAQSMYEKRTLGKSVLELNNYGGEGFENVNLNVKQGEIIGFTGLQGAGCSEILQTIFGVKKPKSGRIFIHGEEIKNNRIQKAMKNKVAMVAANRKENSIFPDMNLLENMYLSEHVIHYKKQHIYKKEEIKKYDVLQQLLDIKSDSYKKLITGLSGGNQQKVILARWLNTEADIFLFDNPTQGIDVGAKSEIYKLILNLSKEGKTIIVNTLEIPEIQKIADRCVVFYHGNIQIILNRQDINEEMVMLHATNAVYSKEKHAEVEHDKTEK